MALLSSFVPPRQHLCTEHQFPTGIVEVGDLKGVRPSSPPQALSCIQGAGQARSSVSLKRGAFGERCANPDGAADWDA